MVGVHIVEREILRHEEDPAPDLVQKAADDLTQTVFVLARRHRCLRRLCFGDQRGPASQLTVICTGSHLVASVQNRDLVVVILPSQLGVLACNCCGSIPGWHCFRKIPCRLRAVHRHISADRAVVIRCV